MPTSDELSLRRKHRGKYFVLLIALLGVTRSIAFQLSFDPSEVTWRTLHANQSPPTAQGAGPRSHCSRKTAQNVTLSKNWIRHFEHVGERHYVAVLCAADVKARSRQARAAPAQVARLAAGPAPR